MNIRNTLILPLLLFGLLSVRVYAGPLSFFKHRKSAKGKVFATNDRTTGEIRGRVMGALLGVKDARVTLTQNEKIVDEAFTDQDGYYSFKFLNPGYYDLKGTKSGYRTNITHSILVQDNGVTITDFYIPKFNNLTMHRYPIVESYRSLVGK